VAIWIPWCQYRRRFVRVSGWLFNHREIEAPQMIYLLDLTNQILGLGLIGEPRPDVSRAAGQSAKYSGFQAHLSSTAVGDPIAVFSPGEGCVLRLSQPP
jgi:hypothetical protein